MRKRPRISHAKATRISYAKATRISYAKATRISIAKVTRISHAKVTRISHAKTTRISHAKVTRISHAKVTRISHAKVYPTKIKKLMHTPSIHKQIHLHCSGSVFHTHRERVTPLRRVGRGCAGVASPELEPGPDLSEGPLPHGG